MTPRSRYNLGDTLLKWRTDAGLSQQQLAAELRKGGRRVSRQMISLWEQGRSVPYPPDIRQIGEICHVAFREVSNAVDRVKAARLTPRAGGSDEPKPEEAPVDGG